MGILGSLLGRRPPVPQYRTIDGGHPAPYPDMTDEQLYNYEEAFRLPKRTFDRPPVSRPAPGAQTTARQAEPIDGQANPTVSDRTRRAVAPDSATQLARDTRMPPPADRTPAPRTPSTPSDLSLPPLDFSRPVRTITTRQPVEIITTRARHPVYKVHGYIGQDQVVTVFTMEGQLSEGGPRFLENVPESGQLHLNIYAGEDPLTGEKYRITQHASREEADALALPGRLACVPVALVG